MHVLPPDEELPEQVVVHVFPDWAMASVVAAAKLSIAATNMMVRMNVLPPLSAREAPVDIYIA